MMDLNLLDEPFPAEDIEWRIQQCGKTENGPWAMVLCYVTNRAIMKRLDDVCGKSGWKNEYRDLPNNGGVECGISINVHGEWITKWDAAENTQVEAVKGGRSSAMKRAAVQWGIGRYLYQLEERFANCSTERNKNWNKASYKDKKTNQFGSLWWETPTLPAWALPVKNNSEAEGDINSSTNNPISLEDAVSKFSNEANLSQSEEQLTKLYKSVWDVVLDSELHKNQVIEIYRHKKSEFKVAA